jgi:hypothetical protein
MAIVAAQQCRDQVATIAADPPVAVVRRLHREHVETDAHESTSLSNLASPPAPASCELRLRSPATHDGGILGAGVRQGRSRKVSASSPSVNVRRLRDLSRLSPRKRLGSPKGMKDD